MRATAGALSPTDNAAAFFASSPETGIAGYCGWQVHRDGEPLSSVSQVGGGSSQVFVLREI
jgi:hypothetical protein